jgi:hypothetical protein
MPAVADKEIESLWIDPPEVLATVVYQYQRILLCFCILDAFLV